MKIELMQRLLEQKLTRRQAISTGGKVAIGAAVAAIIAGGGVAAYDATRTPATSTTTATITSTVPPTTITSTVTPTTTLPTTAGSSSSSGVTVTAIGYTKDYIGADVMNELTAYGNQNNITVNWIESDPATIANKITLSIASGTHDYDVVDIGAANFWDLNNAGWILDLDPYMTNYPDDYFLTGVPASYKINGHWVGTPWDVYQLFFYYRKDLFEQNGLRIPTFDKPYTQSELMKAAKTLNDPTNGFYAFVEGWQTNTDKFWYEWTLNTYMSGGKIIDGFPGNVMGDFVFNSPAGVQAITRMKEYWDNGWVHPVSLTVASSGTQTKTFIAGKAAMMYGWSYAGSWCEDPSKSQIVGKWGITTMPGDPEFAVFPGGVSSATTAGADGYVLTKLCPYPDSAFKVMEFLCLDEKVQAQMITETGNLPAIKAPYTDPTVLQAETKNNWLKPMLETMVAQYNGMWPFGDIMEIVPGGAEFYQKVSAHVMDAIMGKVPIQDALNAGVQDATAIRAKAVSP